MTTGEKIKFLLEKNDLKQTDLAKYLSKRTKKEVSANTVNRWIPNENPNKKIYPPSQKYLSLIADYFNVSVDVLLDDSLDVSLDELIERYKNSFDLSDIPTDVLIDELIRRYETERKQNGISKLL